MSVPSPAGPRERAHPLLEPLSTSWGLQVLCLLAPRGLRFNRLLASLPGCSHKVLTDNLRRLERDGLVHREVRASVPVQVEYSLTDDGRELAEILGRLRGWVDAHAEQVRLSRDRYDAGTAPRSFSP